ncbi:MAG: hypothetical protein V4598_08145 [Bdellovibrionota bacterium]
MELIKFVLFAFILSVSVGSARAEEAKSGCVIIAQDPVIRQFFREKGFEVDSDTGNFRVEFEVTCEAIDVKKEKFASSEIHQTTTKIELFNQYENQKVVYHSDSSVKKSGRVDGTAFVVPCADTRKAKAKLLEAALESAKNIDCGSDEE